ncbi:hypothetical protein LOS78_12850 [Paracoccus sp. MA]|uniref:hypothetical protein n=1 Tax=Paracoccus sp. MA TaxID=2895796 RepID=UPI001E3D25D2|nr:hypothetical protein [Paracoccus sp. MA]UFM66814.1 hypothetical protein LOS78_12850 [Paracoccus sp. MA]
MSWNPHAAAALVAFPDVFASPSAYGFGIDFADPITGKHLLYAADFLDGGVQNACIPPLTITSAREVGGSLELTIRLAVPITIDVPAAE